MGRAAVPARPLKIHKQDNTCTNCCLQSAVGRCGRWCGGEGRGLGSVMGRLGWVWGWRCWWMVWGPGQGRSAREAVKSRFLRTQMLAHEPSRVMIYNRRQLLHANHMLSFRASGNAGRSMPHCGIDFGSGCNIMSLSPTSTLMHDILMYHVWRVNKKC